MTQLALFDTRPIDATTHILMPSMSYACGLGPLDGGHFQVGIRDWAGITCAECVRYTEDEIRDEIAAQQGRQA